MGTIPPNDQFLFYIQKEGSDPQFVFENTKDGLDAIHIESPLTSSIASVIGIDNYRTLIETVRKSNEKIVDKDGNTTYLVRLEDGSKLAGIKNTELVTLRNVKQLAKAVKEHKPSRLTPQFSSKFLNKAPLLLDDRKGISPLEKVTNKDKSTDAASQILCTSESAGASSNENVDLEHNTLTIGDHVYKIKYTINDREQNLEKVPPHEREAFLLLIRESIIKANSTDLDSVKSVTLSFNQSSELTEIKSFSTDPSQPIIRLTSNDKLVIDLKNEFQQIIFAVNQSVTHSHKASLAIAGVPRGLQNLTCWFGSGLQMAVHLFGEVLEEKLAELQHSKAQIPDYLDQFIKMKRKILKEDCNPIEVQEVTTLFESLKQSRILDDKFSINGENDPQDFIGALTRHADPFVSIKNIAVSGENPAQLKDLLDASLNLDPIVEDDLALNIFIERNIESNKLSTPITLEKIITLDKPDGSQDIFELVGAAEHTGNSVKSGHYIAYSYQNGKWYQCNDEHVQAVDNQTELINYLSTTATQLIYRRLPQKINSDLDAEIDSLHSLSVVDTDKWLKSKVVVDWAQKIATATPDTTVITKNSNPLEIYKVGKDIDIKALEEAIEAIAPGQKALIPLIKVKNSTDQSSKHFVALVIDKTQAPPTFEYFDSTGRKVPDNLEKLGTSKGYTFINVINNDNKWQQNDGYRCGYYISRFFELRSSLSAQEITAKTDERHPNHTNIEELQRRMRSQYNRFKLNYGFEF